MDKIKRVLTCFCYITTLVVFATAIYIAVFWGPTEVSYAILWQILGTTFLCSLGMLFQDESSVASARRTVVGIVLYYLYVNAVVLTAGVLFEWFLPGQIGMLLGMVVLIALIYALLVTIFYRRDKALADKMTDCLREREKGGEE